MTRILVVAGLVLIGAALSPIRRHVVGAFRPVEEHTATQAAWAIASSNRQPVLLVLYSVESPLCRDLFPQIVALCDEAQDRGVRVLAYSTDTCPEALRLGGFLDEQNASFEARRLAGSETSELSAEFRALGIILEQGYAPPLIVVRDRKGHVVHQGHAVRDLAPVRVGIDYALKGGVDPRPRPGKAAESPSATRGRTVKKTPAS